MLWLRENDVFDIIHFSGSSGEGFHTLQAREQGLLCLRSTVVTSLDSLLLSDHARANQNDPNAVVEDIEILRHDFLYQKSVELAVSLFFVSTFLFFSSSCLNPLLFLL